MSVCIATRTQQGTPPRTLNKLSVDPVASGLLIGLLPVGVTDNIDLQGVGRASLPTCILPLVGTHTCRRAAASHGVLLDASVHKVLLQHVGRSSTLVSYSYSTINNDNGISIFSIHRALQRLIVSCEENVRRRSDAVFLLNLSLLQHV